MKNITELNEGNFELEVTNSGQPVLVDFWASWCGPCKMIAPVLEELAGDYSGKIKIAKVNVEEQPDLAQRFNVQGLPTLLYFSKGQVVAQTVGAASKKKFITQIESVLAA